MHILFTVGIAKPGVLRGQRRYKFRDYIGNANLGSLPNFQNQRGWSDLLWLSLVYSTNKPQLYCILSLILYRNCFVWKQTELYQYCILLKLYNMYIKGFLGHFFSKSDYLLTDLTSDLKHCHHLKLMKPIRYKE